MSERRLRLASGGLAAMGAAITAYLVYVRQAGGTLACSTGGCEAVQSSSYAAVLGTPVAALGLAGFLGLLLAALALAAFLFSAYLLYIQLVVIDAICQWCVATDVFTSVIAALALLRLRHGEQPT
jgi:uncharacterized membrane protein